MNLAGHRVRRLSGNYFEPCHKITSEPEGLLFLPHRCIESMVCPLTDIVFPHNVKHAEDEFLSMLTLLPVVLLILFIFPHLLLLMKLKSSKVLFRFTPLPPLAIISLKPQALTDAISNHTDWHFCKCGQLHRHLWHAHILLYFLGKITVLLSLFRFGFKRIINWTVLFPQYHA